MLYLFILFIIISVISKTWGLHHFIDFIIKSIWKLIKKIVLKFIDLKNRYTLYKMKNKDILEYIVVFIKSEFNIYRFNFKDNDKIYPINIVSSSNLNPVDTTIITKKLQDNWELRNLFVHVGINDSNDNELHDITELIRSFYYHFDDNLQECKFKYFIEYIKDHENIDLDCSSNLNIPKTLVIYINDDEFTQRTFKINDILETTYKDLFKSETFVN